MVYDLKNRRTAIFETHLDCLSFHIECEGLIPY